VSYPKNELLFFAARPGGILLRGLVFPASGFPEGMPAWPADAVSLPDAAVDVSLNRACGNRTSIVGLGEPELIAYANLNAL